MQFTKSIGLAAALVMGFAAQSHAVVIGTPGQPGDGTGFPFGANPGGRYQQVYGSSLFTQGAIRLTDLSFYVSSVPTAPLAPGNYTLSFSTTTRGIDGLEDLLNTNVNATDAQVFNSNVGADSAVVFNGALPAVNAGRLTIPLSGAFTYNPNAGNLLLDVQSAASSVSSVFFDFNTDPSVPTSRLFVAGGGLTSQPFGLVTEIVGVPAVVGVPEPASLAVVAIGLFSLASLRRRTGA